MSLSDTEKNRPHDGRYYRDRAAYMRGLAKDALTDKLRESCLKSAERFEFLAMQVAPEAKPNGKR